MSRHWLALGHLAPLPAGRLGTAPWKTTAHICKQTQLVPHLMWTALILVVLIALILTQRFCVTNPWSMTPVRTYFKYGSTGGGRNLGFPYWIWRVLPEGLCRLSAR